MPWQALDTLLRRSVALAYEVFPPREEYQWRGLSVFAFDGSPYHLPATAAMRQAFDPQSGLASPGRGHYPQCLVMTAYDVFRRLPVGRTICALQDGDERAQAQHLLPLLPPNSVSLFDRGFPSYGFLTLSINTRHRYVHALSGHLHLPCCRGLRPQWAGRNRPLAHALGYLQAPSHPTQRRTLASLRLRAIRLAAPDGTVSVLLTNLVDPRRFPRTADYRPLLAALGGGNPLPGRENPSAYRAVS